MEEVELKVGGVTGEERGDVIRPRKSSFGEEAGGGSEGEIERDTFGGFRVELTLEKRDRNRETVGTDQSF